jgi:hypothetical protein
VHAVLDPQAPRGALHAGALGPVADEHELRARGPHPPRRLHERLDALAADEAPDEHDARVSGDAGERAVRRVGERHRVHAPAHDPHGPAARVVRQAAGEPRGVDEGRGGPPHGAPLDRSAEDPQDDAARIAALQGVGEAAMDGDHDGQPPRPRGERGDGQDREVLAEVRVHDVGVTGEQRREDGGRHRVQLARLAHRQAHAHDGGPRREALHPGGARRAGGEHDLGDAAGGELARQRARVLLHAPDRVEPRSAVVQRRGGRLEHRAETEHAQRRARRRPRAARRGHREHRGPM